MRRMVIAMLPAILPVNLRVAIHMRVACAHVVLPGIVLVDVILVGVVLMDHGITVISLVSIGWAIVSIHCVPIHGIVRVVAMVREGTVGAGLVATLRTVTLRAIALWTRALWAVALLGESTGGV